MADQVIGDVSEPKDDLEFLREDTEPEKEPEEKEPEEEEDEETEDEPKEETEDEEETTEEEPEEEDEEDEPEEEIETGLVTSKDLKAKFPEIFKKFPELKGVIYRERQYSEIFADPKDAQTAAEQAKTFVNVEQDLMHGVSEPLLNAIHGAKGSEFKKLAAGLLPALRKIDEPMFMKVIAVPFKQMLRKAFATGNKNGDKNLALSARHIHNFIFDDDKLDDREEFENEDVAKPSKVEEEYRKKLEELDTRDHKNFKQSVDMSMVEGVKEAFFDKFDPDGTLTPWIKDRMFEDAVRQVDAQLVKDPRHMKNMELLWRNAKAQGYSPESKSRIVNAVLARARQIIPQVRQQLRSEALAKNKKETVQKKFKVVKKESSEQRKTKPRDTEMSDLDFIRS